MAKLICNHNGIKVVLNRFGGQTHCNRYWLVSKPQPKSKEAQQ